MIDRETIAAVARVNILIADYIAHGNPPEFDIADVQALARFAWTPPVVGSPTGRFTKAEPADAPADMVETFERVLRPYLPRSQANAEAAAQALLEVLRPWLLKPGEVAVPAEVLAGLTDADECRFDHHGYCQTHRLHEAPCPNKTANEILAAAGHGE